MKEFKPEFESLRQFECPEWLKDAKFGIWSHWGPQSVPMFGDWYARYMYIQGTQQNLYHVRHYGHPSKFGYKDICKLWKAEKFDPDYLMDLYYKAGARYFVAQATHHDHFFNYDSQLNPMNSVKVGPRKDICSMWKQAADKHNMPFGLSEHLAASFSWWGVNKGCDSYGPYKGVPYDGNDPEYKDFYYDNYEHYKKAVESGSNKVDVWMTPDKRFHEYWKKAVTEMVDKFKPDMLYSDSALPFTNKESEDPEAETSQPGLDVVSHLYNTSIEEHGKNEAVYCQKDRREEVYKVGILDIERSQLPEIAKDVWQTDTCIGGWFYHAARPYKRPEQIIEMLVDIISKNGVLLLNIIQRPDGTIDDEAKYILEELASWYAICGDAVYGTRPYRIFGEGDTRVVIKGFTEEKTPFNSSDWRFVTKNDKLYAFMMAVPDNHTAVIKSLTPSEKVKNVKLMGCGDVNFNQSFGVLCVELPENMPTKYTNCLEIEFE